MKTYSITYEIYGDGIGKQTKRINVEAGSKKLASIRAMHEISMAQGSNKRYVKITAVEPIATEV